MNRRSMLRHTILTAGGIAVGGPLVISQTACGSTKQLAKWAGVVANSLEDISPILADMGGGAIVALIGKAIPIAKQLKKAFEDNDNSKALTFWSNLVKPGGLIEQIVNQIDALKPDSRKRTIQGILAIGMVALRLIEANIQDEITPAEIAAAEAVVPDAVRGVRASVRPGAIEQVFNAVKF